MLVYTSVLPIALWQYFHWTTVLVAPVVAFMLMGIENIGNQIENPILVLPMASYCKKVHHDILGMIEVWVNDNLEVRRNCTSDK